MFSSKSQKNLIIDVRWIGGGIKNVFQLMWEELNGVNRVIILTIDTISEC